MLDMKFIISAVFIFIHLMVSAQNLTENDIKQLAHRINNELQGTQLNGVIVRGCFAIGRTLVYQYDVSEDWYAPENMKRDLIANFKEAGYAEMYFNNDVNVDFHYYYGNSLKKKISIKASEFSNLSFSLGDYMSISGHPKAKDVNLQIKKPNGWDIQEGDRPNIVKKFIYKNNSYIIMIKDNVTFFSRNEVSELLADEQYVKDFLTGAISFLNNPEIINHKIVKIDKYPTLEFTIKGEMESSGIRLNMILKNWVIFYEDKLVYLQCGGLEEKEFKILENLYDLITYTIIFPEQYN